MNSSTKGVAHMFLISRTKILEINFCWSRWRFRCRKTKKRSNWINNKIKRNLGGRLETIILALLINKISLGLNW